MLKNGMFLLKKKIAIFDFFSIFLQTKILIKFVYNIKTQESVNKLIITK